MSRKNSKASNGKIPYVKQTQVFTRVTHVYMSFTSQNFRLHHVSNLSVRNIRIFLLMSPGSLSAAETGSRLPLSAGIRALFVRTAVAAGDRETDVFACLFRPSLRNRYTLVFRIGSRSGHRLHILSGSETDLSGKHPA